MRKIRKFFCPGRLLGISSPLGHGAPCWCPRDLGRRDMIRPIRRMVYKAGFRPKYPSVLFSPSQHMAREVFPAAKEGLLSGFKQASQLISEIQNERPSNPSETMQADSCWSLSCIRIEAHKHGPACDFNCGCEKGQAIDAEQRS